MFIYVLYIYIYFYMKNVLSGIKNFTNNRCWNNVLINL